MFDSFIFIDGGICVVLLLKKEPFINLKFAQKKPLKNSAAFISEPSVIMAE